LPQENPLVGDFKDYTCKKTMRQTNPSTLKSTGLTQIKIFSRELHEFSLIFEQFARIGEIRGLGFGVLRKS
jgi:hypothetical protein